MDCKQVRELLPWYLNGTLEDSEKKAISEHLATCSECRRELVETRFAGSAHGAHLPTEVLLGRAHGVESPNWDRQLIDSHLESCEECSQLSQILEHSRLLRDAAQPPLAYKSRSASSRRSWRHLAVAAGLAAVLSGAGWFSAWQELRSRNLESASRHASLEDEVQRLADQNQNLQQLADSGRQAQDRVRELEQRLTAPRLNTPVFDLFPGDPTLRGVDDEGTLTISQGTQVVTLTLNPQSLDAHATYDVEIRDASGQAILSLPGLLPQKPEDYFAFAVSAESLPEGTLSLILFGVDAGRRTQLETFRMKVRR